MPRKKKIPWTKAQLTVLHECWKASHDRRECFALIARRIPEMPPPIAWSLVRKLSRTDPEWQKTARRKERDKEERATAKERVRQERLRRRDERQKIQEWKTQRESLRAQLCEKHAKRVAKEIGTDFFFCSDVRQHVCRLSCVFRVFSGQGVQGFSHGGPCEKCERMDGHIPALEKIVGRSDDEGQESEGHPSSRKRREASGKKTGGASTATSKATGDQECTANDGQLSSAVGGGSPRSDRE